MRYAVLGPLEVDGGRVSLGGPQQRAVLAVLLLSANRVVPVELIAARLWGDEPPAAARSLVQGCVAGLRRALGGGAIVTRPPGYLVVVRPGELDLDRLDELEAAGDLASLDAALALWRGPVLGNVGGALGPGVAAGLEERRLALVERRADAALRLGRLAEAVGLLTAPVRDHPLRERPWARLVLALYAAGRRADALAAYREVRAVLVDQLGVEPGAELRDLERAVLTGADPAPLLRAATGPPPPDAPPEPSVAPGGPPHGVVLAYAAVLGPLVSIPEAVTVAAAEPAEVLAAVAEGTALGLVTGTPCGGLRFRDEAVRASFAARLGPRELLDAHARSAVALGGDGPGGSTERAVRRANHAVHASGRSTADARLAVGACRDAARRLAADADWDAAADLLGSAVRVQESAVPGPLPAALLVQWAEAVLASGRLAGARDVFGRAAAAARAEGDPVLLARAALGLGGVWVAEHRDRAERERMLALQRDALAGLPEAEAGLRARLRVRLAAEAVYTGGDPAGVRAGLAEARASGDRVALAEALSLTHHALLRPDHTAERLELADELVEVASAAGEPVLVLMGLCWRAVDLFHLGDPAAERALTELRGRAGAVRSRSALYVVAVLDVMLLLRAGRLDEAEDAAAVAYKAGVEVGDEDAFAYWAAHLLTVRWLQGRGAELLDLATEAAGSPTLVQAEFTFRATAARLAADAGDVRQARALLARIADGGLAALPLSSTWLMGMLGVVEAARAVGAADVAREAYDLLLPYADLPVMPSVAVVCFGSTHRALGLAALAAGDRERGLDHLERAVAANDRLGNRPLAACARAELGLAMAPGPRAAALVARACAGADAMGMAARAAGWRAAYPGGVDLVEDFDGEDYLVRRITGSASTKPYRCPGCDQLIRTATPHVVAWPADDDEAADRRHWHSPCWEARSRRSARLRRHG